MIDGVFLKFVNLKKWKEQMNLELQSNYVFLFF